MHALILLCNIKFALNGNNNKNKHSRENYFLEDMQSGVMVNAYNTRVQICRSKLLATQTEKFIIMIQWL